MDGLLLIAIGHELYAKFAYNCALSFFCSNPNIPITIVTEESCIGAIGAERIKDLENIGVSFVNVNTEECIIDGKKNYQLYKLRMPELSPYNKTLYLDADTIINNYKNIGDIFGKCTNIDFQPLCAAVYHFGEKRLHGHKYTHWGKIDEIVSYHKLVHPFFYQTQTSAICFDKTESVKDLYKIAYNIYLDKNIPSVKWAGGYPDEYCFNVALNVQKRNIMYPFTPIHGHNTNGEATAYPFVRDKFYGMQVAGVKFSPVVHKVYNNMANVVFSELKKQGVTGSRPFPLIELEKKQIEVRRKM